MLDMLLVSCQTDLRLISLDVPYFTDVILPIQTDLRNAVAADFDPLTGQLTHCLSVNRSVGQLTVKVFILRSIF